MLLPRHFYIGWLSTIVISLFASLYASHLFDLGTHDILSYVSIAVFAIICWFMYMLSERAAHSSSKQVFIQLVMMNTMIKMFTSVILVIGYFYLAKPSTVKFIIPFVIIYIIFTAFEVGFSLKQSANATK